VWEVIGMDLAYHTLELRRLLDRFQAFDVTAVAIVDAHTIVEGTLNGHVRVFDLNTG
jgi:hypothetical protein